MPHAIGIVLAVLTARLVGVTRFDRDRAVSPVVLIVIASYYVLFAVMGGAGRALGIESLVMLGFTLLAVLGFSRNPWWVVAALAGHGIFDFVHGRLVANAGVPSSPASLGRDDRNSRSISSRAPSPQLRAAHGVHGLGLQGTGHAGSRASRRFRPCGV